MEPRGKDNLDRWLDRALQEYGQALTAPGLEGRILEQLSGRRTLFWAKLSFAFAGMGAVAALLATLWVGHASHPASKSGSTRVASSRSEQLPAPREDNQVAPRPEEIPVPVRAAQTRPGWVHRAQRRTPKLDQFPSPRPLSPQERMLKQYVQAFPDDALSLAREQAQLEKEFDERFGESTPGNQSQQER